MSTSDRLNTVLAALDQGDYHQAEMFIKTTTTRLNKDKKLEDTKNLLIAVVEKLHTKPPQDLKEVPSPQPEPEHDPHHRRDLLQSL